MATTSEILYVGDIDSVLYYSDGSTKNFTIESPNGDNSIEIEVGSLTERQYRDGNNILRKGYAEYYVKYVFSYQSHYMDLLKIYLCDYLELPIFIGDFKKIENKTKKDFVLLNDTVVKNFLSGLRLTKDTDDFRSANPVPNGSVTLEMQTAKPVPKSELLEDISWYQKSATVDEDISIDSNEITIDQI